MRNRWTTIPFTLKDRQLLVALLSQARWQHRHVDWADAFDLIGQQPFLMAMQENEPIGCLACPPDPPEVSWLRFFVVAPGCQPHDLWDYLWPQVASELMNTGVTTAAVLLMGGWLAPCLQESGFTQPNSVVFLEWRPKQEPAYASSPTTVRAFRSDDLPKVVQLDNLAFEPLWRYSEPSMLRALAHASTAVVSERQGEINGYMIVSSSALGAHIARLAVEPKWQGQGFGSALVRQAMKYARDMGVSQLTVNTQSDNKRAKGLYRSLGFKDTNQFYPVWVKELSSN